LRSGDKNDGKLERTAGVLGVVVGGVGIGVGVDEGGDDVGAGDAADNDDNDDEDANDSDEDDDDTMVAIGGVGFGAVTNRRVKYINAGISYSRDNLTKSGNHSGPSIIEGVRPVYI